MGNDDEERPLLDTLRKSVRHDVKHLVEQEGAVEHLHLAQTTSYSSFDSSSSQRSFRSILHRFTKSQRFEALQKPGVGQAAFLIRDAVLGTDVEHPADGAFDPYVYDNLQSQWSVLCSRICSYRPFVQLQLVVGWILLALTFVEPPKWCQNEDDDGYENCRAYFEAYGVPAGVGDDYHYGNETLREVEFYPNAGTLVMGVTSSRIIETVCVAEFAFYTLLKFGRDGLSVKTYFRPGTAQLHRILQLLCLIVMIVGLNVKYTSHHPYTRMVLLISLMPNVQRDLRVLCNMLPEIFNVLLLLGVFVLFYAWFGTVMFVGSTEGELHFSSLVESVWSLYIMITTANYPDVMMPSYNDNRLSALYFVSFMILSFFFFMNVVLASVVNEYDTAVAERKESHTRHANECLHHAYQLMDVTMSGRIDRETVMALFVILNEDFPEFRTLSDDDTKLLFAILDQDGSSTITEEEFMNFGSVLLLEFVKASDYATWIEVHCPNLFATQAYQAFVQAIKSAYFEYAIDGILVMNAVVIGIQSYPELAGQSVDLDQKYWDGSIDTVWELWETIFTAVYVLEVSVKIMVLGRRLYFENAKNVFDFTITALAVISTVVVYYPNEYSDSRLVRMIVMARVLRLIRLLTAMKRFQLIGAISAEILPKATSVLLILFFLMYFFAVMGVHLYGGLITRDPSNPLSHLVLNTDFSENEYWANNFNDMLSAMNLLFNLLVVNNWTECEIGYEAVTQGKWVRIFFFAFHFFGVVLVNNLVIAFIISAFLQQLAIFKERTDEEIVDGEAVIRNREAIFDASEVTGTKTSLSGGYIARLRKSNSDIDAGHDQDRLRQLFTQRSSAGVDK